MACGQYLRQLMLLCWKNLLVQLRAPVWTIFELAPPIILVTAICVLRAGVMPISFNSETPFNLEQNDFIYDPESDSQLPLTYDDGSRGERYIWPGPAGTFGHKQEPPCFVPEAAPYTYGSSSSLDEGQARPNLILFAPNNAKVNTFMEGLAKQLDKEIKTGRREKTKKKIINIKGFRSEQALEDYAKAKLTDLSMDSDCKHDDHIFAGVVFHSFGVPKFDYSIRMPNIWYKSSANGACVCQQSRMGQFGKGYQTKLDFPSDKWTEQNPLKTTQGLDNDVYTVMDAMHYHDMGFVPLQHAIDRQIIKSQGSEDTELPSISFARLPYPKYRNGQSALPLTCLKFFLVISMITSALYSSKCILTEIESNMKDYMLTMGLSNSCWWLSHFVFALVKQIIICISMAVLLRYLTFRKFLGDDQIKSRWGEVGETPPVGPATLGSSDISLVFLFLQLWTINIILVAYTAVCVCGKGWRVTTFLLIFWLLSMVPSFIVNTDSTSAVLLCLSCLMLNSAVSIGLEHIWNMEKSGWRTKKIGHRGNSLSYSTLLTETTPNSEFCFLYVLVMLLAQMFVYLLIIMCCDSHSSLRTAFRSLRHKMGGGQKRGDYESVSEEDSAKGSRIESAHGQTAQPSIVINHLKKTYRTGLFGRQSFTAVDRLSFDVLPNQLTVLLGHNGAGKSTTFAMLTGSQLPTSGTATICGFDVYSEFDQIRQRMGFCPQHNILFEQLSVRSHLEFFCRLKGNKVDKDEIDELLDLLTLTEKQTCAASTLSGGQKRKLSVGIALVGHSEIVLLDEPSSGVDAQTRHEFWKLLQQEKTKRTIVMTTHYMEEADVLGDRIVIMTHGKLHTAGTSMFLKRKYGAGYHVSVQYTKEHTPEDIHSTQLLLQAQCGPQHAIKFESQYGPQATFLLPYQARNRFSAMFAELNAQLRSLHIHSFGVSVSTLEEVFIKVGEEAKAKEAALKGETVTEHKLTTQDLTSETRLSGKGLCFAQFKGLLLKRAYCCFKYCCPSLWREVSAYPFRAVFWLRLQGGYSSTVMMFIYLVLLSILLGLTLMNNTAIQALQATKEVSLPLTLDHYPNAQIRTFYNKTTDMSTHSLYQWLENGPAASKYSAETKAATSARMVMDTYLDSAKDRRLLDVLEEQVLGVQLMHVDNKPHVRLWYSGEAFHSLPIAVSVIDNALLHWASKNQKLSITTNNHPLPVVDRRDKSAEGLLNASGGSSAMTNSLIIGIVMPLVALCFVVLVLADYTARFTLVVAEEKQSGMKHLQYTAGLGPGMYWLTHFLWDYFVLLIPASVIFILFGAFGFSGFFHGTAPLAYWLLFVCFGAAQIPTRYLITYVIKGPTRGMILSTIISLLTGLVFCSIVFTVHLVLLIMKVMPTKKAGEGSDTGKVMETLEKVVMGLRMFGSVVSPMFNMAFGLFEVLVVGSLQEGCKAVAGKPIENVLGEEDIKKLQQRVLQMFGSVLCMEETMGTGSKSASTMSFVHAFGHDDLLLGFNAHWLDTGVGFHLVMLLVQAIFYWSLIIAIDNKCWCRRRAKQTELETSPNEDVAAEEHRVRNIHPEDNMLIAQSLKKTFKGNVGVQNVSFGVSSGECFGLLGVNGAGKTTTFKMLTGELPITQGEVYLNGLSVRDNWRKACTSAGYCPQFEAVLQGLTGQQLLRLFARLRGIPDDQLVLVTNNVLEAVDITRYKDRPFEKYSGGTKRRCSLGLALIGVPSVLMLDEPTTGVDPVARRALWEILKDLKASHSHRVAILLTSHSMEECDALCDRLSIMVRGQFSCLGSPQYLKSRFGTAFTLNVRLNSDDQFDAVNQTICQQLPGATCTQHHHTSLQFNVPVSATAVLTGGVQRHIWPGLFALMEQLTHSLQLLDYSLSQSTLEDVFLAFSTQTTAALPQDPKQALPAPPVPSADAQAEYARKYAEWAAKKQAWQAAQQKEASAAPTRLAAGQAFDRPVAPDKLQAHAPPQRSQATQPPSLHRPPPVAPRPPMSMMHTQPPQSPVRSSRTQPPQSLERSARTQSESVTAPRSPFNDAPEEEQEDEQEEDGQSYTEQPY